MGKDSHFSGQPLFNQLLSFIDKGKVRKIGRKMGAERYVKRFDCYHHLVVMLFVAFQGYESLREVVTGLLANSHKLAHLGLNYIVKRSTLSEANARRTSSFFESIYKLVFEQHRHLLADSRINNDVFKKLYLMDSTTITLFKAILKGTSKETANGKQKGGIKAHTIYKYEEQTPVFVSFTAASVNDHVLLKDVNLPYGSFLCFDRGYVDYEQYELFTQNGISYITRMKDNAVYQEIEELDIPDECHNGVIKDEIVSVKLEQGEHKCRRIAFWDAEKERIFVFVTNNMELPADIVTTIYKERWKIELLFKQLKQNFPLKYFLGDNVNTIEIQIWATMLANLLVLLVRSKLKKRSWAFSNIVSTIRRQLMSYVNIYSFLEDPEKTWLAIIANREKQIETASLPSLFSTF